MARLTSTPTTLNIVSTDTPLFQAAARTASNTFVEFAGVGLLTRTTHPVTGNAVTVLEDGRLSQGYQTLGYSGKGCYDPTSRQVLWASTGAGSNYGGGYVHNTQARYSEATGAWSANRAFKGVGDPASKNGLVHIYDSNCIDVAGRRAYKKWFSNDILVYNIDSNSFLANIAGPSGHSSSFSWDALEVVPSRGRAGALWMFGWASSNAIQLWEYDLATGNWSILISAAEFGNQGSPSIGAPVLSYNPRAFNGAGGVMLGNESSAWVVNIAQRCRGAWCPVPPSGSIQIAHRGGYNSGFCRDPSVRDGFNSPMRTDLFIVERLASWERRATMPARFGGTRTTSLSCRSMPTAWSGLYPTRRSTGWLYRP